MQKVQVIWPSRRLPFDAPAKASPDGRGGLPVADIDLNHLLTAQRKIMSWLQRPAETIVAALATLGWTELTHRTREVASR